MHKASVSRSTSDQVQTIPRVIQDIDIGRGHHQPYVREQADQVFAGDPTLALGMRYLV